MNIISIECIRRGSKKPIRFYIRGNEVYEPKPIEPISLKPKKIKDIYEVELPQDLNQ